MRKLVIVFFVFLNLGFIVNAQEVAEPQFYAIEHASFVIKAGGLCIFVDPVGAETQYSSYGKPDIILITHEHGDHLNVDLVNALKSANTVIVGTEVVIAKLGMGRILKNEESVDIKNIHIEALAAYNNSPERLKYHPKGRANGYLLSVAGKRIYISGDTEDVPELLGLKDIDYAFICMNLPYTMTVEQAAHLILSIKPSNIYPYHYRNQDKTYADIETLLPNLIGSKLKQNLHYLDWYKQ